MMNMKTLLEQGDANASRPASTNVFGVISTALERTGRHIGCWDASRFSDGSRRNDVTPDPTVTTETLAYAFAAS
jgi:hypothetical protein